MLNISRKFTALFLCTFTFLFSLSFSAFAVELNASARLKAMLDAQKTLSYELNYIQISAGELDSFRYRHTVIDGQTYAQLMPLEGMRQEIVQRGELVGYFNPTYAPTTLKSRHIIDNLPQIMYADIEHLAQYYDFVEIGRNRVADRLVQVIRILPKDQFRFQYVVYIDMENHLLLRSEVLDRDGNLLEQFLVINVAVGEPLQQLSQYVQALTMPSYLDSPAYQDAFAWQAAWLPNGFQLISRNVITVENVPIETALYSDGLFSFTVSVSQNNLPDGESAVLQRGYNTIYSESNNGREITLIGQIPISTAKRIAQDLRWSKP